MKSKVHKMIMTSKKYYFMFTRGRKTPITEPISPVAWYFNEPVQSDIVIDSIGTDTRTLHQGYSINFTAFADEIVIPIASDQSHKFTALDSDNNVLNTVDFDVTYSGGSYHVRLIGGWPKKLWNVKVWDSSKTPLEAEIRSKFADDSWAWYRCDESAGVILLDATGNMNHAQISGATRSSQIYFSWHNRYGFNVKSDYVLNAWSWQTEQGWVLDDNALIGQLGRQGDPIFPMVFPFNFGYVLTAEFFEQGFDVLKHLQQRWGRAKYNAQMNSTDLDGDNFWSVSFSADKIALPKVPDLIQADLFSTDGVGFYFDPSSFYDAIPQPYANIDNQSKTKSTVFWDISDKANKIKNALFYGEKLSDEQLYRVANYENIGLLLREGAHGIWDDTRQWGDDKLWIER